MACLKVRTYLMLQKIGSKTEKLYLKKFAFSRNKAYLRQTCRLESVLQQEIIRAQQTTEDAKNSLLFAGKQLNLKKYCFVKNLKLVDAITNIKREAIEKCSIFHFSFSRSKYFHLLIVPIQGFRTLIG